jgi:GNAT superfamily N-acetyltransferase
MQRPEIVVTDCIDKQTEDAIGNGLASFNKDIGYGDHRSIAVIVRDPDTGETLGGATGRSYLGLLFLDLFYLPPSLRGSGLGSEILKQFEDEGKRRGCVSAVLYTISFQAPGFYERHGWRRFGEIACQPAGTSRVFMTKQM